MRGERSLLRRMLRNLIDNARRYGGDAAPEVTVGRRPAGLPASRCATTAPASRKPSASGSSSRSIASPGSAETGRGSGLGLALVRQIARHHGGDVQCGGAAGGGSAFRVLLPATA